MKALFFIVFLAIIVPVATEARLERKPQFAEVQFLKAQNDFEEWVKNCGAKINLDTLTLQEVLKLRTDAKKDMYGFVITSTESVYGPDFRRGVYWPDGVVVDLPVKFDPDCLEVKKRNNDLALHFVTNDSNGGFSFLTISLPPLPSLKDKVPCDVKIEAIFW